LADRTKTSIYIDDDILKALKIRAAQTDTSVTEIMEVALRGWIATATRGQQPSPLDGLNRQQRKLVENYIEALRAGIRSDMLDVIAVALAAIARGKEAQ
jgi:hypothetical protein